jgi:hypothetical protein
MKLPQYAPAPSDRISTREELFEVLEMLGGFEEPQVNEALSSDLLSCLSTDPTVSAAEMVDASNEEHLLVELEPFSVLRSSKVQRIH